MNSGRLYTLFLNPDHRGIHYQIKKEKVRAGALVFKDQLALLTFSISPWDFAMASADIFRSFSI